MAWSARCEMCITFSISSSLISTSEPKRSSSIPYCKNSYFMINGAEISSPTYSEPSITHAELQILLKRVVLGVEICSRNWEQFQISFDRPPSKNWVSLLKFRYNASLHCLHHSSLRVGLALEFEIVCRTSTAFLKLA